MSFRYNNIEPAAIKYNGSDVTCLKYNNEYVWAKAYNLKINARDVNNVVVNRLSSKYGAANIERLFNDSKIYHGDILQISASGEGSIKTFTVNGVNWNSGSTIEVVSDVNISIEKTGWKTVWQGSESLLITTVLIGIDSMQRGIYSDPFFACSDNILTYLTSTDISKIKISGKAEFLTESTSPIPSSTTSSIVNFNDIFLTDTILSSSKKASIELRGLIEVQEFVTSKKVKGIGCILEQDVQHIKDSMIGEYTITERPFKLIVESIKVYYDAF